MKPFQCVQSVANAYGMPTNVLLGRSRVSHVSEARQVVMFILVRRRGMSASGVGRFLKRNHGSVLHGLKTVAGWLEVDAQFRARYLAAVRESEEDAATHVRGFKSEIAGGIIK
tara:strand:+ start:54 stop:392 length:339 start_codon:yes stop_codon:yes gene_type:complete